MYGSHPQCGKKWNLEYRQGTDKLRSKHQRMKPYVNYRFREWKQEAPCVSCKRSQYSPIYFRGYRSLCKICLETDYEELKKKYDLKGRCLFV